MEMHLDRLRAGIGPPAMKFPFGSAWIPSTAPILSDDAETVQRRPGRSEESHHPHNTYKHARIEDFSNKREIGKGRNTVIYSAICTRTNERVAIKTHTRKALTAIDLHRIKRECKLLRMLRHEHIIKWLGIFEDADCIYLVQEHASGGDLFEHLKKWGGRMPEKWVITQVLIPLMKAMREMHNKGVIHRDIKPENILVAGDETIKLCDFGLAINARTERPASRLGTLQYMAPEVVKRPFQRPKDMSKVEAYDEKVDMWACGVLVYELIVGYPPFDGEDDDIVTVDIMHREVKEMPDCLSPECKNLVLGLLQKRPADRLSLEQLWQHPLILRHSKPEDLKPARSARVASSKPRPGGDRAVDRSRISDHASSNPQTLAPLPSARAAARAPEVSAKPPQPPALDPNPPVGAAAAAAPAPAVTELMARLTLISRAQLHVSLTEDVQMSEAAPEPAAVEAAPEPFSPPVVSPDTSYRSPGEILAANLQAWHFLRSFSAQPTRSSGSPPGRRPQVHAPGTSWAWLRDPARKGAPRAEPDCPRTWYMYRILPGGRRKSHHSIRIRSRSWGQRSERPRKGGRRALANGRRGLSPLGALHRRNDSPMSGTESESESREPARAEKRLPEGRGDSPERGGTVEDAVACRDRNGEGTAGRSLFAERDVGSAEARADALRDARAHCSGNEAMGVEEEQTAPALPPSPGFLRWFNFF